MENNELIKFEGGLIKRVSTVISITSKFLALSEPQLIPYRKKDKWGFCTLDKKIVIDCVYHFANQFTEDLAWVVNNNRKGSFINKSGVAISPFIYGRSDPFSDGLAKVSLNERYGFINKKGEVVIPCIYDSADSFSEGLAVVGLNDKHGFVDLFGQMRTPCIYDIACKFKDGSALVDIGNEYNYIDETGKVIEITDEKEITDELFDELKNGKHGFIDANNNVIIPHVYDTVGSFNEGLAYVKKNGKYGFINKRGKQVIPCKYDDAFSFFLGLAFVTINEKDGFINKEGVEYWED